MAARKTKSIYENLKRELLPKRERLSDENLNLLEQRLGRSSNKNELMLSESMRIAEEQNSLDKCYTKKR